MGKHLHGAGLGKWKELLFSVLLAAVAAVCMNMQAYAAEAPAAGVPYVSTIGALKADAPMQKLVVTAKGFTFEKTMAQLAATWVVVQDNADGSRLCHIPDVTAVEGFAAEINAALALVPAGESFFYYDAALPGFQTYPSAYYEQINAAGKQQICYKLLELLADKKTEDKVLTLPDECFDRVYAEIPADIAANRYAIKGSCTTSFKGSSGNRIQNIKVAASHINHMILFPGQEVSMNQAFQPRTYANGYREAGAYLNGKVVPALGGGICQVSSTIYNAAMNSGLTVLERHPHSMPVHYLPLAMDAAISSGSKDLRLRNDYPFPVLFEGYTEGNYLTINIYTNELLSAGMAYRLHSVRKGSLAADAYLEISVNGIITEDRALGTSRYNPMLPEGEEAEE